MRNQQSAPGFTLVELLFVLALLAILCGFGYPHLTHAVERFAVRAAADDFAAQVAHARIAAIAYGGADLLVDAAHARTYLRGAAGEELGDEEIGRELDVTLDIDGANSSSVTLSFDALGIGRAANRTILFRRGQAEARAVVSAYGRVRTW